MRIFVTGATGFIGAHFIECALAAGHSVAGLYRSERPGPVSIATLLRNRGAALVRGDILQPHSFAAALEGADCVCHFAGAFRESGADERYFDRINVEGTTQVLKAAVQRGVRRFVHCSTAGIYGQRVGGVIDENTPIQPWNSYERSKLAGESVVRAVAPAAGMEFVILRPTAVYGPRDERLLKLFRSVAKGRFPLFGPGDGRRHMIYVTDLAEAFLRACVVPSAAGQALIVAGPRAAPLLEILQTLARAANRRVFGPQLPLKPMMALAAVVEDVCARFKVAPPIYRRRMDFYLNDAAFDSSRAQRSLEWRPEVDLAEGLAATLASLQSPNLTAPPMGAVVLAAMSLLYSFDSQAAADVGPSANVSVCSAI
ncbi:MAG: NAD-dependent epimerase/dehydratase family protein [Steroidobacter sp.]